MPKPRIEELADMLEAEVRRARAEQASKSSVYELDRSTLELAVAIADAEVRTILECAAKVDADHWIDTTQPAVTKADPPEDVARLQYEISRALAYIALRGQPHFDFEMTRHPDKRHLIKFRSR